MSEAATIKLPRYRPRELILNTKDDRREIITLLLKLSPNERRNFLAWCCRQVDPVLKVRPKPAKKDLSILHQAYRDDAANWRYTLDLFYDFWALVMQYGCDPVAMSLELETRVRRLR